MRIVREDLRFLGHQSHQRFIHRPLGDESVRVDLAGLSHASDAGDGLTFGRGLELRLHQDDDLGALEIDPASQGVRPWLNLPDNKSTHYLRF